MTTDVFVVALVALWLAAGASLLVRRPGERFGLIVLGASVLGAASSLEVARPYALGLLPAAGLHIVTAMPDGALLTRARRVTVGAGWILGAGLAGYLALQDEVSRSPVIGAALVAAFAGAVTSTARYRHARGIVRQRMHWFGWAVTVAGGVGLLALGTMPLVGWPTDAAAVAAVATAPIPIALALGGTRRLITRIDRLLAHTVSLAGLTGLVVVVYLLVIVGLGRIPTERERTIIGLSMAAAVVSGLLYLPTRARLTNFANRVVYGERQAPDEVLRTFGTRLSRAIPLDESLLQMVESMRKTFGVDVAEVWTGSEGTLDRTVSDPERPPARITLGPKEQPVVARAGVSGPAWIKVWLSQLLEGREGSQIRVAPITHSGELLGLIVAERRSADEQFTEEQERVMTELARQVGLALHNVQLDSALQKTLDELRRQAESLRASRQRLVASEDAARRKIERDIHDGAQQRLVALRVKLRLAERLAEGDPQMFKQMLGEMSNDMQEAVQELRELSHGVYPKILTDQGVVPALEGVAATAALPTSVESAENVTRYKQEVEAAIYFCCREALQNAGKHAGEGARATIRLWQEDSAVIFEVADTGAGFDRAGRGLGAGFTNMEDRLGAVGGTIEVKSEMGRGTTIRGKVPTA